MRQTWVGSIVALFLAACSGSTTTAQNGSVDAGAETAPTIDDDAAPPSGDEGAVTDASVGPDEPTTIDIFDAFPIPDGPIGACVECLRDNCAMQISGCINSASCRTGLLCTVEQCLPMAATSPEGGLDPVCALGCFGGDFAAALEVQGGILCVGMNCNDTCGKFVGGGRD